jgi:hypothetical protein
VAFLAGTSGGSDDSLYVALIGLAGALLGAVALVYTSRYKGSHENGRFWRDLTPAGREAYEENSNRLDRVDERIGRLERRVDFNSGRIDHLFDGPDEQQGRHTEPSGE